MAISISEGRAPELLAGSEKERLRCEMNTYRTAFWERKFVACVRWLCSQARMVVYIAAIVVLPGLLFPPIRGYLNQVMVTNLVLMGFVVVPLVAGEVINRKPRRPCIFDTLSRLLLVGSFAIAYGYVSEADPWKEIFVLLLGFAKPVWLQIQVLLDYAAFDHTIFMWLGVLLAHHSLRTLAKGGKTHLKGTSRFKAGPGWTLKDYYIGSDPREQQGRADVPSVLAYHKTAFHFYLGRFWVLFSGVHITVLMFLIISA